MQARYNSIGFTGPNCSQTFVNFGTDQGEIRALLTKDEQKHILSSHHIGKTFIVSLKNFHKNNHIVQAHLVDVKPA